MKLLISKHILLVSSCIESSMENMHADVMV